MAANIVLEIIVRNSWQLLYFRKIVIEATIPTIWFHLLMAADVLIVLGIGCWMYKKYNTRFLYYV